MVKLYGKEWTRRDLEARVGRIEQIAGIQRFTMSEGSEAGLETFRVRTGSGLSYWVTPGKGMDISLAEMGGVPISWSASNGEPNPTYYNESGVEWLKTASGGLLMTCGLTQVGSPGEDSDGTYGLHGRIHHTPARHVSSWAGWNVDDYEMSIRGVVEETSIFGFNLRLTRTITSILGENNIRILDTVENIGFRPAPHMILYHFNFGFPLLSEDTIIELPEGKSKPRDLEMDTSRMHEWQAPDPYFNEQVFYHEPSEQKEQIYARIYSPSFPTRASESATAGIIVDLKWDPRTLPKLVQWRMPGAGDHVLGLEPSNCWTRGRAEERKDHTLKMLEPGEIVQYNLDLEIKPY
ncbi:aldose 1-epimerase family protein [Neobacillus sp. 179-J 1A1 HS]|uniref:aldose 1-epimerase family protein n=1 Tax=Neobacillus driksii TaxID=3035913 RepID=UPI0035BBA01D